MVRYFIHLIIGIALLTLGMVGASSGPKSWRAILSHSDERITRFLEGTNRYPLLDYSMELLTLGTPVIELGTVAKEWTADSDGARQLLVAIGATQPVVVTLKYLVNRPRPPRQYQPRLWNTRITPSLPSGHATATAAYVTVLSQQHLGSASLLLSYLLLSGYAQVYIGNHYLRDVLGGWIIGYGIGRWVVRSSAPSSGVIPVTANLRITYSW